MRSLAFFTFFLIICFGLAQLIGQDIITVNPSTSATNQIDFECTFNPNLPLTCGAEFVTDTPYHQVFWIFGDGNFKWDKGPFYTNDVNALTHSYLAHEGFKTTYQIGTLILDRKTDNPPPARLTINTSDSITGLGLGNEANYIKYQYSGPIIDYVTNPANTERVGLINSHYEEPLPNSGLPGYYFIEDSTTTVFVLAFAPEHRGKLLFFYPDDEVSDAGAFDNTIETLKSRYSKSYLSGTAVQMNALTYEISTPSPRLYHKVLEYSISSEESALANGKGGTKEELRIFHILKANNIQKDAVYSFMVVLVSEDSIDWNTLGSTNFNTLGDKNFVANYVDARTGSVLSPSGGNSWFVDAAIINVVGGEPKDPNLLRVTNISKIEEDDYRVSFELTFCNINDYPTKGANILIKDCSNHFEYFKSDNIKPIEQLDPQKDGDMLNWANDSTCKKCSDGGFSSQYDYWDARFCVSAYSLADLTDKPDGDCAKFRFTAHTTAKGLEELLKDNTITACVQFHEVVCETVCSESRRLYNCLTGDLPDPNEPTIVQPKLASAQDSIDCKIWENKDNLYVEGHTCQYPGIWYIPCTCKVYHWLLFLFSMLLGILIAYAWHFLKREHRKKHKHGPHKT